MALISCPECGARISDSAFTCPHCGYPGKAGSNFPFYPRFYRWGFQWKSKAMLFNWPLVHIAIGRDKETGKLLVARGIIAIGQFAIGLITVAQFGAGLLFGFGQFIAAPFSVGQFAVGLFFGLGQFATGQTAIGQIALGEYVLAQMGFGRHVWSTKIKDPVAIEYFRNLLNSVRNIFF